METKEVLERWEFKVEYEEGADHAEGSKENVDTNVAASQQGFRNVSNKVGSHYSGFFFRSQLLSVQNSLIVFI